MCSSDLAYLLRPRSYSLCTLKQTGGMSGPCDSPLHWSFEDAVSTLDCTPDSQIVPDLQFIPPTAVKLGPARSASGQQRRLAVHVRVSDWKIRREDLEIRNELSRTLHSTLYLADWKGTTVVVKCAGLHGVGMSAHLRKSESQAEQLETEDASDSLVQEILQEIETMSQLRHPDLVMFLGACLEKPHPVMCITEFLPCGDLERFFLMQRKKRDGALWRPCLRAVLDWCLAIARALNFLHNRDVPVIHRDLKPLNLFLTSGMQLKVGDLGSSRRSAKETADNFKMTGGLGTWRYMAPEMARHEHYNEKVDIYAFGLVMYFMSSGRTPFHQRGADPKVILDDYVKGKRPRPPPSDCYAQLRPMMVAAWQEDFRLRPTAQDILVTLNSGIPSKKASCGCAQM